MIKLGDGNTIIDNSNGIILGKVQIVDNVSVIFRSECTNFLAYELREIASIVENLQGSLDQINDLRPVRIEDLNG